MYSDVSRKRFSRWAVRLQEETYSLWGCHKGFSKEVAFDGDAVTDRTGYLKQGRGYFRQKDCINRTTEARKSRGRWSGQFDGGWGSGSS